MKAEFANNGTGAIIITGSNGKQAKVWDWGSCWQIEYLHNGARKSGFKEYVEVLNYLSQKGW